MSAALLIGLAALAALAALLWRRGRDQAPAPAHLAYPEARRVWLPAWPSQSRRLATWLHTAAPASAERLPHGGAEELVGWAATLTAAEQRDWAKATRAFCANAGLDLSWLWGQDLARDPDLLAALADTVMLYSLSYCRARRAAPTAVAVKALRMWRAAPGRGRGRRFGDELHTTLVRQGLLAVPAELYLAPERRRRAEAIAALRRLDAEDHIALRSTVELMLAGAALPPPPARTSNEAAHGDQLPALDARPA